METNKKPSWDFKKSLKSVKKWVTKFSVNIIVALSALMIVVLVVTAAPPVSWVTTPSANCLAQGPGNSMVEMGGFLYILYGNTSTGFGRYNESTGNCVTTGADGLTLAQYPSSASSGATLTKIDANNILATTGGNTSTNYIYNIPNNFWISFNRAKANDTSNSPPIPQGSAQSTGDSIVAVGTDFYSITGNASSFQKYSQTTNTWTTLTSTTVGASSGAALAYPGSGNFIYAFTGNNGTGFYRYCLLTSGTCTTPGGGTQTFNTWATLQTAPTLVGPGGAMAMVGNDLYAFGGNGTKNFWKYDTTQTGVGTWTNLTATNTPPDFVQGGGAMVTLGTNIYAFSGNNTKNFWKYNTVSGVWSTLTQTPDTLAAGASLTTDGTNIYAVRGRASTEFWKYDVTIGSWSVLKDTPTAVGANSLTSANGGLAYSSALGEIYLTSGNGTGNIGSLFRYKIVSNTWPAYLAPPILPANANSGASGTYPGSGDFIYFLKGSAKAFWKYSLSQNIWIPWNRAKIDATTPLSQTTLFSYTEGDGNSILEVGGKLYMLVGGTTTFLTFDSTNNMWKNLPNAPTSIAAGASMVKYDNNTIYVESGTGFWKYDIPNQAWIVFPLGKSAAGKPFSQLGSDNGFGTTNLSQGIGNSITELNGKFYILPGASTSVFLRFDPVDNSWFQLPNVPAAVANGGSIVTIGTNIYVLPGGNQSTFYKFDTNTGIWTTLTSFGGVTPKTVNAGGSMTAVGTNIYALRGGNASTGTSEFWKYDTVGNSWTQLGDTPYAVQGGAALTSIGTNVYALAGNGSNAFWKYDTTQSAPGTWNTTLDATPGYVGPGGALTTDGTNIYATQGNNQTAFWKFNPAASSGSQWTVLNNAPTAMGSTTITTAKGGIAYSSSANGDIYMVSGNGVGNFPSTTSVGLIYRYQLPHGNADDNTWPTFTAPTPPPATYGNGGALTYPGSGNFIYSFKGNTATDFWKYDVVNDEWWSLYRSKFDNGTALSQANSTSTSIISQNSGNTMAEVNGKLYVIQGGTTKFQVFDPTANTWTNLTDLPMVSGAGSSIVKIDNNTLYIYRGGGFNDFWKYTIDADTAVAGNQGSWTSFNIGKRDDGAPFSQNGTSQTAGSNITKANNPITGLPEFYFNVGNSTTFEKFNPATNTWTSLAPSPGVFANSSPLVSTGTNIYVMQGGSNTGFWQYNIAQNLWTVLTSTPAGATNGEALAYPGSGNFIYALQGGQAPSTGFWRYCMLTTGTCTTPGGGTQNANTWTTSGTLANTPAAVSGGGALAFIGNTLYAFGGANTNNFWSYDVTQIAPGTWTNLTSTNGPPDTVRSGGALASDGTYLYATRGNFTKTFWRYNPAATSGSRWSLLDYVPAKVGTLNSDTSTGGGLVYCNNCGQGEIWVSPLTGRNGYATSTDYETGGLVFRYKIDPVTCDVGGANPGTGSSPCAGYNTWPYQAKTASTPVPASQGASLAYPGSGNTIYGSAGGSATSFMTYNTALNLWNNFSKGALENGNPISQFENVIATVSNQGAGNSIVQLGGKFYILAGGSTNNFMKYDPVTNIWTQLANTPITVDGRVSDGGALTTDGTNIYALRGFTSQEFWKYNPTLDVWTVLGNTPATIGAGGSLGYPGSGNFIYAFRGTNTNTMYKYDITQAAPGSWGTVTQGGTAIGNVQGGGAMIGTGGNLYAFRGNGTPDFYKFTVTGSPAAGDGTWTNQEHAATFTADLTTDKLTSTAHGLTLGSEVTFTTTTTLPAPLTAGTLYYVVNPTTNDFQLSTVRNGPTMDITSNGTGTHTWHNSAPWLVQSGGSLTTDGTTIYATHGGGTTDFASYNIAGNTWNNVDLKSTATAMGAASTNSAKGGIAYVSLGSSGGPEVYAVSGNGFTNSGGIGLIYRYKISTNTWPVTTQIASAPAVMSGGGWITSPTSGNFIYALQGNNTQNFWLYDKILNEWNPNGFTKSKKDDGTAISQGGTTQGSGNEMVRVNGKFYLFPGNNTGAFQSYDPVTNSWTQLESLPTVIGDGAALVSTDSDTIYALQGNNTTNSFRYKISTGHWVPLGPVAGLVLYGGSLGYPGSGNYIYAFQGNNGPAMYRYDITQTAPGVWTTGATLTGDATNDKLLSTAHGLPANAAITVANTGGAVPGGLSAGTTYWVVNPTANDFQVSATRGGAVIDITSVGTGTNTWVMRSPWNATAGAAMAGVGGNIYATGGNASVLFSKYTINGSGYGAWDGANFTVPTANTITSNNHGLVTNSAITLCTTGTIPTGLIGPTCPNVLTNVYYVINPTTNTFQVATTPGGSAVSITASSGSGIHTWQPATPWTVSSGGSITTDGTQLYVSRGSATTQIRKYCIVTDSDCTAGTWAAADLAAVPANMGAASLTATRGAIAYTPSYSGGSGGPEIFAVTGNGVGGNATGQTQAVMYRYIIGSNTWPVTTPPPIISSAVQSGGSLATDNIGNIYATSGNGTTNVYRFNIVSNTWSTTSPTGQTLTLPTPLSGSPLTVGSASSADAKGQLIFRNPDASGAYNGDEELYLATGSGSGLYATTATPGRGLLFRYPFSGAFAGTWPLIKTPAAQPASGKTVAAGGSLTSTDANSIFAFRGNSTNEFWRYDIPGDSWTTTLSTPPAGQSISSCTNCVGGGGALTNDGAGNIYATRGSPSSIQTKEFWKYNITNASTGAGTWTSMPASPAYFGTTNTNAKGGIVYYNNNIWGAPGTGKSDVTDSAQNDVGLLYRFDIAGNSWPYFQQASDVPVTGSELFCGGSSLTSTIDGLSLYALQNNQTTCGAVGANTNRFWQYTIANDTGTDDTTTPANTGWVEKTRMPTTGSPVTAKSGGSLAATSASTIYAARGNNTNDIYKFTITNSPTSGDGTWSAGPIFPVGFGEVTDNSARGALVYSPTVSKLFAIPGNDSQNTPFPIYSLAINPRAHPSIVTSIPRVNTGFDVLVEAVDDQGNPYTVPSNTPITLSVYSGTGVLSGTTTGQISAGQNQTTISGVQYSVAESNVVLTATDGSTLTDDNTSAFTVYAQPATLTNVSPASGNTSGGTTVVLTGTNFTSSTAVTFGGSAGIGGNPADSVTFNSSTQLTVVTPPHSGTGLVDVTVINSDGIPVTLVNSFTYQTPTITNITPNTGSTAGQTSTTIAGTNFGQTYYKKPITITNTGSTLLNYNVNFTLDTESLITAGKMRGDCGDLRVKNSAQITNLSYWIESGCNTSTTSVWAKVPSLANGSNTIYVTYGRSSLTTQSSLSSLFPVLADSTNNKVWLKADNGTSQNVAATSVSTWLDQSGNNNSAQQATAANQPTYQTNAFPTGTKPVVRFDGTNDTLSFNNNSLLTSSQFSILAVVKANTPDATADRQLFSNWNSGSNQGASVYLGKTGTASPFTITFSDDFLTGGTFTSNTFHTLGAINSSSNAITYVDGTQAGAKGTSLSARNVTVSQYFLGDRGNQGAQFWNGDLAEILVFNSALSTSDRQSVEQYLKTKYNPTNDSTVPTVSTGSETANSLQVTFDGVSALNIQRTNESTIVAEFPPHAAGAVDVIVTNPDGVAAPTSVGGFTYQSPTVTIANPIVGRSSGGTSVTITGTNFAFGKYNRPITVTNSSGGTLTNTQVVFTMDTASLIAAGKMRSDCGDLRVKDSDQTTDIPYWIESGCNTANTYVWAKIASLTTSGKTIYAYYGNSALTTTSSLLTLFPTIASSRNVMWLKADTGTGQTVDGTAVSTWADQTTNGNTVTQATGANQPLYKTNILNGRPVVRFDGSNDVLSKTGFNNLPSGTAYRSVFTVTSYRSNGFGGFTYGTAASTAAFGLVINSSGNLSVQTFGTDYNSATTALNTGALLQEAVFNGLSYLIEYKNGASIGTFTTSNLNTGTNGIQIGAEIDGSPFLNMDLAEALVFNTPLSNLEKAEVENYIKVKYNLFGTPPTTSVGSETTSAATVTFGGTPATNVIVTSSTTLTATTPAHSAGAVNVVVTNPDAQAGTLVNGFNYLDQPTVTSVSPTGGINNQTYSTTINGTGFTTLAGGSTVKLTKLGQTDINCTNVNVASPILITCDLNISGSPTGDWDVVVTNPDGQIGTLSTTNEFIISYAPPAITNVNPNFGSSAGGTNVTITGSGIVQPSYSKAITITSSTALTNYQTSFTQDTAALILAGHMRSDCGDIRVKDSDQVTDIPYWIEDSTCNTATTKIWTKVPSIPNGSKFIYLTYGNSALTTASNGNNVFEFFDDFNSATINSTKWPTTTGSPSTTTVSGLLTLPSSAGLFAGTSAIADNTIWETFAKPTAITNQGAAVRASSTTGTGFVSNCSTNAICLGITWWSDNRLYNESYPGEGIFGPNPYSTAFKLYKVTFRRSANIANYDYDNGAGTATMSSNIVNDSGAPGTNVFPVLYSASGNLSYDWIRLRKYTATEPNISVGSETGALAVTFGGTAATNVVYVSSTQVTATTPAHSAGLVDVVFTNTDGQNSTLTNGYTFLAAPTVTSITPNTGVYNQSSYPVTIGGTNFSSLGSGPTAKLTKAGQSDIPCTSISSVSATSLSCNVNINGVALGNWNVVVTNPDGQVGTLTNGFQVVLPAPSITSINPNQGPPAGGTSVAITGSNFQQVGYQKPINITNTNASSPTNYQVRFSLDSTSLISAGKMRSDCGDLRVKDTNATSDIPYWIESGCNSTPVTFTASTSTERLTSTAHNLPVNTPITLSTTGTLPAPLTANTTYYVINTALNDFQLATTPSGSAIDLTTAGSGTNTYNVSLVVWAKVPALNGSGTNGGVTTIYATYGNSSLTSQSNGDNTFIFFDDFESGSINTNKWVTGGSTSPYWITDSTTKHQGTYSSSNADINDSQYEVLVSKGANSLINVPSGSNAVVDFYWKVSSEGSFDFLRYCFDNTDTATSQPATQGYCSVGGLTTTVNAISGTSVATFAREQATSSTNILSSGLHRIEFSYNKDGSQSTASDTGWVDAVKVRKILFTGTTTITENVSNGVVGSETQLGRLDFCNTGGGTCTQATSLGYVDSSHLTATTPAHSVGTVDVKITNPDGQIGTLTNGFTYYTPTADATNTTVDSSPVSIEADGTATSTITVTVRDQVNNTMSGVLVEVNDNGSGVTYTPSNRRATTNGSGVATVTVKSTTVQSNVTFTATADPLGTPVVISDTAAVSFTTPIASATVSTLTASPSSVGVSNGSTTGTLTATILNANSFPIQGHTVQINQISGPASATITPVSPTTNSSGQATFTVSSNTIGSYVFRATDLTANVTLTGHDVTVNFIAGAVDPGVSHSTLTASPTTLPATGSSSSTLTATLKDLFDNITVDRSVHFGQVSGPSTATITPLACPSDTTGNADFAEGNRLTNNAAVDDNPSYAFTEDKILFTSQRDGNKEIYSINTNGTGLTRLTNNAATDDSAVFYNDDSFIIFSSNRSGSFQLWEMDPDGTNLFQLTTGTAMKNPSQSLVNDDIALIRFTNAQGEVYIMHNEDDTDLTRLTNNSATEDNPSFSPDGTKVVFQSDVSGNNDIWIVNSDGTGLTNLTNLAGNDTNPTFTADGTHITFTSNRNGNNEIYTMDLTGSNQTRLTNNSSSEDYAAYNPIGLNAAFASDRNGNSEIYASAQLSNSNGKVCATVSASQGGTYVFNATSSGVTLDQTASVTFTSPDAASSTLTAVPTNAIANGQDYSLVTATIKDVSNNVFPNQSITLSKIAGTGSPVFTAVDCTALTTLGTGANATTNSSGQVCYKATSLNRGTFTFRARDNTESFNINQTVDVTYGEGAAWDTNGKQLASAVEDDSTYRGRLNTKVVKTSDGGFVTGWMDDRNPGVYTVGLQKFDANGNNLWPGASPNGSGILVDTLATGLTNFEMIADTNGGVMVFYSKDPGTGFKVYGQRYDANGNALWNSGSPKIVVSTAGVLNSGTCHLAPSAISMGCPVLALVADGTGGVFLGYQDLNTSPNPIGGRHKVTRLDSNGDVVTGEGWPMSVSGSSNSNGCTPGDLNLSLVRPGVVRATHIWQNPPINVNCQSAVGVTYHTYQHAVNVTNPADLNYTGRVDTRTNYHIDPDETSAHGQCSPNSGSGESDDQYGAKTIEDGNGGVYVVVIDDCRRLDTSDDGILVVNFKNKNGVLWNFELAKGGNDSSFTRFEAVPDGAGGVIVLWAGHEDDQKLFLTRIRNSASNQPEEPWNGGTRITVENTSTPYYMHLVPGDTAGSADVVYSGTNPTGTTLDADYFLVKKYDSNGNLASGWSTDGVNIGYKFPGNISPNVGEGEAKPAVEDGSGGIVVVGDNYTYPLYSVTQHSYQIMNYIQRVGTTGSILWNNTNPLEISPGLDILNYPLKSQADGRMAYVGNNEYIMAWQEEAKFDFDLHSATHNIHLDKFNSDGDHVWQTQVANYIGAGIKGGFNITPSNTDNDSVKAIADQTSNVVNGQFIAAWRAVDTSASFIIVDKFDTDGNSLWGNVAPAASGTNSQPDIVSDGNGGAFITWIKDGDVFAAKLNSSTGANTWSAQITNTSGITESNPHIIYTPGTSNLYVIYEQNNVTTGKDILVSLRFQVNGSLSSNATVDASPGNQEIGDVIKFTNTSSTGFIIAYTDDQAGPNNKQIKLKRMNSSLANSFFTNTVGDSTTNNLNPRLAGDSQGGAYLVWEKYNSAGTASNIAYARLLNNIGGPVWDIGLLGSPSVNVLRQNPAIVADGTDTPYNHEGFFVSWQQNDAVNSTKHIYTSHVINGIPQEGTPAGLQLSNVNTRTDINPRIATDTNNTVITTWEASSSPPDVDGQSVYEADSAYNSTFGSEVAVPADGQTVNHLVVTLNDQNNVPISGHTFRIDIIGHYYPYTPSYDPTIVAVICNSGDTPGVTNANGQACFDISHDLAGFDWDLAATDITDPNNLLTLSDTLFQNFYYVIPQIDLLSPNNGSQAGGNTVTVTGHGFYPDTQFFIDGDPLTMNYIDYHTVEITMPAHAAGDVVINALNVEDYSNDVTYTYNAYAPTVTQVTPNQGPENGGTTVTITGDNFTDGATVRFGNELAPYTAWVSSTELTALTPPHAIGLVDVTVTNPNGTSGTLTDGYEYVQSPLTCSFTTINMEYHHALGIKADGTVWGWGANDFGELGDETTTSSLTVPVQVHDPNDGSGYLHNVIAVAAGDGYSLALKNDGTVWAWGKNNFGQLGTGDNINSPVPVQVLGLSGITKIDSGFGFGIALDSNGEVWSWGFNSFGQLGNGGFSDENTPAPVPGLTGIVSINAGANQAFAITDTNEVWGWGYNEQGQLGIGSYYSQSSPVQIASLPTNITKIATNGSHTMALQGDGTLWATGTMDQDQVASVPMPTSNTFVIVAGISDVKNIAAGTYDSYAVTLDNTFWAWGRNDVGALGNGNFVDLNTPEQNTNVPPARSTVLAAGYLVAGATVTDGISYIWGADTNGISNYSAIPLVINSACMTPHASTVDGGIDVTISGYNFVNGATVDFDGVSATNVQFIDSNTLIATNPAHGAGTVDIVVTNPDSQTLTYANYFRYLGPPVLDTVDPNIGTVNGGTQVTLTGSDFFESTVTFDGLPALILSQSDTTIIVQTPAHAPGPVDVRVTNVDGQFDEIQDGFTYYVVTTDPSLSTVTANPASVPADGTTASTVTVTIRDNFSLPIAGSHVGLASIAGPGTPGIDAVDCTTGVTLGNVPAEEADTGLDGQACFKVTNTVKGTNTFQATNLTENIIITQTADVTFTCVVGPNEQCAEVTINGGTGALTVTAPDDFNFPPGAALIQSFSQDDPGYVLNVNDVVDVSDTRNASGFNLQVQADPAGFGDGAGHYLPLQDMYVATKAANTGGTQLNGIEYSGIVTTPQNIVASQDTTASFTSASSFTTCGSGLGTGGTLTTPGTSTPVDLMLGGLSSGGRNGDFKQNVNYLLDIPAGTEPGNYNVTLTYTVTDDNSAPPSTPPTCP